MWGGGGSGAIARLHPGLQHGKEEMRDPPTALRSVPSRPAKRLGWGVGVRTAVLVCLRGGLGAGHSLP